MLSLTLGTHSCWPRPFRCFVLAPNTGSVDRSDFQLSGLRSNFWDRLSVSKTGSTDPCSGKAICRASGGDHDSSRAPEICSVHHIMSSPHPHSPRGWSCYPHSKQEVMECREVQQLSVYQLKNWGANPESHCPCCLGTCCPHEALPCPSRQPPTCHERS